MHLFTNRFTISDTLRHFCGEAFFRKSYEKFDQSWISDFLSKVFNRIPGFWLELRILPLTSPLCLVAADCLAGEMCCHWQHCVLSLRSTSLPFPHLSVKQFRINSLKKIWTKVSLLVVEGKDFKCLKCICGWKSAFRSHFITTTRNSKF